MADSIKMGTVVDGELYTQSVGDIDMGAIIHCSKDFEPSGEWQDPIFTVNVEFSEGSTFNISKTYSELVAKIDSGRPLTVTGGFRYSRDNDENGWVYYPFVFGADTLFGKTNVHWNAETCFAYWGLSEVDNMMTIEEFRALPDDAVITIFNDMTKKQVLDFWDEQLASKNLPKDFIEITSLDTGDMDAGTEKGMILKIITGGCDIGSAFEPSLYIWGPQEGESADMVHVALGDSLAMRFAESIVF